jgi:hypothetical protein
MHLSNIAEYEFQYLKQYVLRKSKENKILKKFGVSRIFVKIFNLP